MKHFYSNHDSRKFEIIRVPFIQVSENLESDDICKTLFLAAGLWVLALPRRGEGSEGGCGAGARTSKRGSRWFVAAQRCCHTLKSARLTLEFRTGSPQPCLAASMEFHGRNAIEILHSHDILDYGILKLQLNYEIYSKNLSQSFLRT